MFQTDTRHAWVIRTVLKYAPMTAGMILRASLSWPSPFRSIQRVREVLAEMRSLGYLYRQEMPSSGPGRNHYLWYIAGGAAKIVPEIRSVSRKSCLFRGFAELPKHSLATSSFCTEIERSAGEHPDRFQVIATRRDRQFTAKVLVSTRNGNHEGKLEPDHLHVIRIDGTPELFFTEVQVETPLIVPGDRNLQSIKRSFQYRLLRYWAFWKSGRFREHHIICDLERVYRCRFHRFRALIVVASERKQQDEHMRSLMASISNPKYHDLFLFTTLERALKANIITQRIWHRASGISQSLVV